MLPAMGWTGRSFRNFRCWYIAVFPSALLLILSIVVLSVIIMVCILYILILRRAVKTADKIKEFRDNSYSNKGFTDDNSSSTIASISDKLSNNIKMNKAEKETQRSKFSTTMEKKKSGCCWVTSANHLSKLKAVKTVLIVTLCFLGTWAPYFVSVIMYVKCDIMKNGYECIPLEMLTLGPLYLLGCCNSLCDPLIYAWRHSGFKRSLKRLYKKYVRKLEM